MRGPLTAGEGDKDREARQSARWWIGSSQLGEGGEKDKDGEVNGDGDGGADGDGEDELEEADELEEDELEEMVEPRVSPPPVLEHDNDDEAYTLLLDYVRILRTELQFGLPTMYKEQHFVRLPKHPVFVVPGRGRNWLHDRAIFLWLPLLLPGVESIPCPAGLPGCKDLSDDGGWGGVGFADGRFPDRPGSALRTDRTRQDVAAVKRAAVQELRQGIHGDRRQDPLPPA